MPFFRMPNWGSQEFASLSQANSVPYYTVRTKPQGYPQRDGELNEIQDGAVTAQSSSCSFFTCITPAEPFLQLGGRSPALRPLQSNKGITKTLEDIMLFNIYPSYISISTSHRRPLWWHCRPLGVHGPLVENYCGREWDGHQGLCWHFYALLWTEAQRLVARKKMWFCIFQLLGGWQQLPLFALPFPSTVVYMNISPFLKSEHMGKLLRSGSVVEGFLQGNEGTSSSCDTNNCLLCSHTSLSGKSCCQGKIIIIFSPLASASSHFLVQHLDHNWLGPPDILQIYILSRSQRVPCAIQDGIIQLIAV